MRFLFLYIVLLVAFSIPAYSSIYSMTDEVFTPFTNGGAECKKSEDANCNTTCDQANAQWYEVLTDADATILIVDIDDGLEANFELREGSCDGAAAFSGTGDSFNVGVFSDQNYFLKIELIGDQVLYDICLQTFLQLVDCASSSELEVIRPQNPLATSFDSFCPGETVTFCHSVEFNIDPAGEGNNCQWLQGIIPVLGCGWDLSANNIIDQNPAGWFWLPGGEVDYNVMNPILNLNTNCCSIDGLEYGAGGLNQGDLLPGGFWFVSPGGGGCTNDGDPDNGWGLPGGCGGTQSVEYCFDLTAREIGNTDCTETCSNDLSVHIFTFADGETGCWTSASCAGDIPIRFDAILDCACGNDFDGDGFSPTSDCDDNNPNINPNAQELCDGIDNNCDGIIDGEDCYCDGTNILVENGSGSFQNTDGPIMQEYNFSIESCELLYMTMDFSTNGSAWLGSGNLEYSQECTNCAGDPLDSTNPNCNLCWDFLFVRLFIGDNLVYENLLGDSEDDLLDGTWSTTINLSEYPSITEGSVIVIGQTFAQDENISYDNLKVSCRAANNLVDQDGDGFDNSVDCDDINPNVFPGAQEICDNIDNNCNDQVDEGLTSTYYQDFDGDGFGNPEVSIESCSGIVGYSLNNTDCDDMNPSINSAATEIPANGIDEDCDGVDGTIQVIDNDNDGFSESEDCDDNDPNINPAASEVCDGVDNNCDGQIDEGMPMSTYYIDLDGDGFGSPEMIMESCAMLEGYSLNSDDCDDTNASINPDAEEIPNNGIDENCDGGPDVFGTDNDADGYFDDVDCDDNNPNINPGAEEICDGVDNNCDGQVNESFTLETYYSDGDMDGYGVGEGFIDCQQPPDTSTQGGDCDDSNPDINPGAEEIPNNDIDEDCNGEALIIDLDGDGWNSDDDCDDSEGSINPDASDDSVNGIDENCDGVDGPSSINEIDGFAINIYPNPVRNQLIISTNAPDLKYSLYSIEGRKVIYGSVSSRIDLSNLESGVYYIHVYSEKPSDFIIHKLIKL